jgi:hypothetical protein
MYEKNAAVSFVVTFLRWLIKPFIVLLLVLSLWFIWLLAKRRVIRWKKAIVVFLLIIAVLLLIAIAVAQIFGSRFGVNLFEYSLI